MKRYLIFTATILFITLAFTATADRRRLLMARNVAAAGGSSFSSPTNLTQRMFWYSGDAAFAQIGSQGQNVVSTLDSIIDGPSLFNMSSRAAGLSNSWVNGKAAILFIGSQDQLTNINASYTWSQPYYVFAVERTLTAGSAQYMVAATNGTVLVYSSGNLIQVGAGSVLSVAPGVQSDWKVITVYYNGASSWIRTNGVQAITGDVGSGAWSGITLGGTIGGTARWNGHLAETFACQDTLTTSDIQFFERQLGTNYGITIP